MRRFSYGLMIAFTMVTTLAGCGGTPSEEAAAPMTDREMEQNKDVGVVPNDG